MHLRKIIASGITCTLLLSSSSLAVSAPADIAPTSGNLSSGETTHITFHDTARSVRLSALEQGKEHLTQLGLKDWIEELSDEEIEKYADISESTVTTSYMKLRELTADEESEKEQYELEHGVGTYNDPREFEAVSRSEFLNEQIATLSTDKGYPIDSGYVKLTVACNRRTSIKDQYMVSGRYEWTTVPKSRGKDCMVLSTNNLTLKPDTFYSITKHSRDYYAYTAMASGAVVSSRVASKSYTDKVDRERKGNGEWEYSGTGGYGVAYTMNNNSVPVSILAGTTASGYIYTNYKGYISYDGTIAQKNQAASFNAFVDFFHTEKSYTGSISVGIPLSGSVSISPSNKYVSKQIAAYVTYNP